MNEMNFEKKKKKEENDKKKIIESTDSYIISAGAGAGKTELMSRAVLNRINKSKDNESSFVVITFTNEAAEELRVRLRKNYNEWLDKKRNIDIDRINIGTIHSFCAKLIMEYPFECGLGISPALVDMDTMDSKRIMLAFFRQYIKDNKETLNEISGSLNQSVNEFYLDRTEKEITETILWEGFCQFALNPEIKIEYDEEINHQALDTGNYKYYYLKDNYGKEFLRFLNDLCKAFSETYLGKSLSRDNILIKTWKLLKNDSVKGYFQKKYKHFFIDEFQDTDYLQLQIIEMLCTEKNSIRKENSLFVVGDKKQSIYRFRGAKPEFFDYLEKYCKTETKLNVNYRSHKKIVDNINDEFGKKLDGYEKMIAVRKNYHFKGDKLKFFDYLKKYAQKTNPKVNRLRNIRYKLSDYSYIPDFIKNELSGKKDKISYGDILIITKTRKEAATVYNELSMNSIPAVIAGKIDLNNKRTLRRIKALVNLLENENDKYRRAFFNAAFSPKSGIGIGGENIQGSVFDEKNETESRKLKDVFEETKKIYHEKGIFDALYNAFSKGWLFDNQFSSVSALSELPILWEFFECLFAESKNALNDVSDYIKFFLKYDHRRILPPSDKGDYVRVYNYHQVKGLDSPVVINIYKENDSPEKNIFDSAYYEYCEKTAENKITLNEKPKVYPMLRYKSRYKRKMIISAMSQKMIDKDFNEKSEELIRGLYVRKTRAKYLNIELYLIQQNEVKSQDQKPTDSNPPENARESEEMLSEEQMGYYDNDSEEGISPHQETDNDNTEENEGKEAENKFSDIDENMPQYTNKSENTSLPPFSLEPRNYKYENENIFTMTSPSWLEKKYEKEQSNSNEKKTSSKSTPPLSANIYGTLMHRLFELYLAHKKLNRQKQTEDVLKKYVIQVLLENDIQEDKGKEVFEILLNDLRKFAEDYEKFYGENETALETPFYCVFEKGNSDGISNDMISLINTAKNSDANAENAKSVLFSGRTDLIVFNSEGANIIDYKSDGFTERNEMYDKYRYQQQSYIICMNNIIENISKDITLYASKAEKDRFISYSNDDNFNP